jgi:hypothetical protein
MAKPPYAVRKLDWYAGRFGDRPEVFAWELWNEVNAVRGGKYLEWTEAMLPELHRRFPRNLCVQSLGSFDTTGVRSTYQRHSTMAGNDLAQVHRYLDLGASLEVCHGPVDAAADVVRELLARQPGKPVILAESGAVEPRHAGPFKLYAAEEAGDFVARCVSRCSLRWRGLGQISALGRLRGAQRPLVAFRTLRGRGVARPPREQFTPSMVQHARLRIYRLTGTRTTLLWCRDTRNDWRSELERGEPPELLTGLYLEIPKLRASARMIPRRSGR